MASITGHALSLNVLIVNVYYLLEEEPLPDLALISACLNSQ